MKRVRFQDVEALHGPALGLLIHKSGLNRVG